MKPLAIDLYCGLGGWTEGFLAEGYDVVGFDIERHVYGEHRYPAQLVIQDVLTLHGSQFRDAAVIVASPPCQEYSYMAMPWSRAKAIAAEYRAGTRDINRLTALFEACFRIAREAGVPVIVENVKGAQPWVGQAKANYGSFYLWGGPDTVNGNIVCGDVRFGADILRPTTRRGARKFNPDGTKHPQGSWFKIANSKHARHLTNQRESDAIKQPGLSGPAWFDHGAAAFSSNSLNRKAASALIAKIPFKLSSYIARCFKPRKEVSA